MKLTRSAIWIALGIVILAAVAVCIPLFGRGFFVSDDGGWMVIRLSAFYQSLREGQFPVRFLGRLNSGYGYPVANFLYPGFMYIGSLIHLAGFPFIETVKILLGGSILTGAVFTFLWLKKYFPIMPSVVGSLGFVTAPYLLFDVYRRGSVGEVLAIAVAAAGFYGIAAQKRWLFGIAVTMLILSHNSLALLFLGFYVLYITVLGAWHRFWLIFGVGIGMATFFWAPAIYERKYVIFDSVAVANPRDYFVNALSVMLLGVPGIIAMLLSLFIKKPLPKQKNFMFTMACAVLILVLPVAGVIWQWTLLVRVIQFPYRLLSLMIFINAWLIAYVVAHGRKIFTVLLACIVVAVGAWTVFTSHQSVVPVTHPEGYYTTNEGTTTVADEYMPIWAQVKPTEHVSRRFEFYSGHGSVNEVKVTSQMIDAVVHTSEDSVLQINTLYYPGWGATLDDQKVTIEYRNPMGVMRIAVPAGDHHLIVSFRETISRFTADTVSLISGVLFIILLFV